MRMGSIVSFGPRSQLEIATIDPFPKRHRLVHNGGFPNSEALYCSLIMVSSIFLYCSLMMVRSIS